MRKLLVLITLFSFMAPSFAEGEESSAVEYKPVTEAEVVLATFNDKGVLEPITEAVSMNADGSVNLEVPETIGKEVPVFVVTQPAEGSDGAQQVAFMKPDGSVQEFDSTQTAIANTFMALANKTGINPGDMSPEQIDKFFTIIGDVASEVPPADTAAETVERIGAALSFQPDKFVEAAKEFNIPTEDVLQVAMLITDAAAPSGYDALSGTLPEIPNEIPEGNQVAGLFDPALIEKFAPKGFDFNKQFGDNLPPPGGFVFKGPDGKPAPIPAGTFITPAFEANSKVPFPENVVFPQGVTIPKGFPMPPNGVLPPGAALAEGFEPPPGFRIPDGVITPTGFDPAQFGAVASGPFQPPAGFQPAPGFALLEGGGFGMPSGFPIPSGFTLPAGASQMPPPTGFAPPPLPKGAEQANLPPLPAGAQFSSVPPGFNPAANGFVPPAGFVPFEPGKADFNQFTGANFVPFNPLGAFDPNAKPPEGAFGRPEPTIPPAGQGPNAGGVKPGDGGSAPAPGGGTAPAPGSGTAPAPGGGTAPAPGGGSAPAPGGGAAPAPGGAAPAPSGPATPPAGGNSAPPPPSGGSEPAPPPPPPPSGGGDSAPPPPPPAPFAVDENAGRNDTRPVSVHAAEDSSVAVGQLLDLTISTPAGTSAKSKNKKITASKGVYRTGKLLASTSDFNLPLIVDPSITASTAHVTIAVDNVVETTDLDLTGESTQLVTQINGNKIEMTTSGSGIDNLGVSTVKAYLLAPGTSSVAIQKAIPLNGTVSEGTSGQLVSFTKPAKLASGVYTVVFQDGDDTYWGKVTIGTLKARTVKATILAPNGRL